jgi:mono/diheme cytochrome c family protein
LIAGNLTKTQLLLWSATVVYVAAMGVATVGAKQATPKAPAGPAMPADATGEQIFTAACATCHAANGTGSPKSVVGFDIANGHSLPDFTDCATNTVEPLADWVAVAHEGGPVRGLDRHMPAFGQALTIEQIERTIKYLWSFCDDRSWPRGDLNFPRAFFTEKAFPESESVITTAVTTSGPKSVTNQIVYEHRIGSRGQYEVSVPIDMQQADDTGSWSNGIGDIELALRRTFFHSVERGSIFAAGTAVALPTGSEERGLGNGYTIVEPFAMFGQMIGSAGFLQIHTGIEIPTDHTTGQNEAFVRTALGYSFAQDRGFGRAWSPMIEVLVAKPSSGSAEWDVVPQMQVSLSKLQHILISVGARIPVNEREERKPQFLTYFLWDWFDGGLFQFWK